MKSKSIVITFYVLIALCSSDRVIQPEPRLDFKNHFVQGLFTHLAQSKFKFESDYVNRLITKNDKEKPDHSPIDIHSMLHNNNITVDFFINLVTNTAHYLQNILNSRHVSIDVERSLNRSIIALIQTYQIFAFKAFTVWNDRQELDELVQATNGDIEIIIRNLAKEIIEFIPVSLAQEFDEVLGILQAMFQYWTIRLARSLSSGIGI